jgi:hypothetical protein
MSNAISNAARRLSKTHGLSHSATVNAIRDNDLHGLAGRTGQSVDELLTELSDGVALPVLRATFVAPDAGQTVVSLHDSLSIIYDWLVTSSSSHLGRVHADGTVRWSDADPAKVDRPLDPVPAWCRDPRESYVHRADRVLVEIKATVFTSPDDRLLYWQSRYRSVRVETRELRVACGAVDVRVMKVSSNTPRAGFIGPTARDVVTVVLVASDGSTAPTVTVTDTAGAVATMCYARGVWAWDMTSLASLTDVDLNHAAGLAHGTQIEHHAGGGATWDGEDGLGGADAIAVGEVSDWSVTPMYW